MFDIASSELILVALIALLVIGPKDLPRVLRYVGNWLGKARRMAAHFRSGIDEMVRQSELEELEKKWQAENERIMREHPPVNSTAREYDSLPPPDPKPAQAEQAKPKTRSKPKTKPKPAAESLP
ncbi:MAG: Sec-independent protein translocase protein TatB [Sphingorhabdus sp.]